MTTPIVRNWAGNIAYGASRRLQPSSLEAVQEAVRSSASLRAIGSGHAFNELADTTGDHLSLAGLPRTVEIDPAARTATIDGGQRYGELGPVLERAGFALANLASLPHISVAGACQTATHGSGDRLGNLSTAVSALQLVRADGELLSLSRAADGEMFAAAVVGLGTLGVVTRLTLDIEPTYAMRQDVYEDLPVSALREHVDQITSAADSVSLFTTWRGDVIDQVWLKRRIATDAMLVPPPAELFGARKARVPLHPIPGLSPEACTEQLGVPGAWLDRMPHFRLDHTPSAGDELQSEFLVDRRHAIPAFEALDTLRHRLAPLVLVSEIRTIASDELWLSPSYRRESIGFHFTWRADWPAVQAMLPAIEAVLEPYEPRPHWAKLFTMAPEVVRSRYPRMAEFAALAGELDPTGKLRNAFVDGVLSV
jgi:xylitol oxidase